MRVAVLDFDAHADDPLAGLELQADDLTMMKASGGRCRRGAACVIARRRLRPRGVGCVCDGAFEGVGVGGSHHANVRNPKQR